MTEYIIPALLGLAVWLLGYFTGWKRATDRYLRELRRFQACQDDLLREIEDVRRSMDAVDWLYSPEDDVTD